MKRIYDLTHEPVGHRPPGLVQDTMIRCFDTSRVKGWWEEFEVDLNGLKVIDRLALYSVLPEKLALIHSEISEALEDYRVDKMHTVHNTAGKPEGFYSELADVVIRIFDFVVANSTYSISHRPSDILYSPLFCCLSVEESAVIHHASMPYFLNMLHDCVSSASKDVHAGTHDWGNTALMEAVRFIMEKFHHEGVDFWAEVERKMAYNKTRPYRHGGKAC